MRVKVTGYDYGRIIGSSISKETEAMLDGMRKESPLPSMPEARKLYQANMEMTQFTDESLLKSIKDAQSEED